MNKILILILTSILVASQCLAVSNVTGWDALMEGRIAEAAYRGYDNPINGYLLTILFIVISSILIINTGVEISFIIGIIFYGMVSVLPYLNGGTEPWLNPASQGIIILILAAELASTLYNLFVKT